MSEPVTAQAAASKALTVERRREHAAAKLRDLEEVIGARLFDLRNRLAPQVTEREALSDDALPEEAAVNIFAFMAQVMTVALATLDRLDIDETRDRAGADVA